MASLEQVLALGQGIERPFRCPEHDDHEASASVNVLKGVWYCFACHARGKTDGKGKPPSVADLEAMLNPESSPRIYSPLYLEQFSRLRGHWHTRFPDWLVWGAGLGHDPLTGDATFPVYTPKGQLAGVGRRLAKPDPEHPKQRYKYPRRWSAAHSMGGCGFPQDVVVVVEGKADATAVGETGAYARSAYGSALHRPQIELLRRMAPKLILLAFDADEAGYKGAVDAEKSLSGDNVEIGFVDWSMNSPKATDPAELSVQERVDVLLESVRGTRYGAKHDLEVRWWEAAEKLKAQYENRNHHGKTQSAG